MEPCCEADADWDVVIDLHGDMMGTHIYSKVVNEMHARNRLLGRIVGMLGIWTAVTRCREPRLESRGVSGHGWQYGIEHFTAVLLLGHNESLSAAL